MKFNLLALVALLAVVPANAANAETVSKFPTVADSVSPAQTVAETEDDSAMGEANAKVTMATAVASIPVALEEDLILNARSAEAKPWLDPTMAVEVESMVTLDRDIDIDMEPLGLMTELEMAELEMAELETDSAVGSEPLDLFSDSGSFDAVGLEVDEPFFEAEDAIALENKPIASMTQSGKAAAAKESAAAKGNKGFRIIFGGGYGGFGRRYSPYGSFRRGYYPYRRYGGSGLSIQFGGGHHRSFRRYRGFSGFYPSFGSHRSYYPYNLYRRTYYPSFGHHRLYYPFGRHRHLRFHH